MTSILWVDLETTGLIADKHGIVELGALIDIDGEIVSKTRSTMKPTGRIADERALKVNGFTKDQIKNLYPWEDLYPELMTFFSNALRKYKIEQFILGGQNIPFDNRFMVSYQNQCGKDEWTTMVNQDKDSFVDTQKIFKSLQKRGIVPASESTKLGNICKYFGVSLENAHTAIGDIEATREVYYKMLEVSG